MAKNKELKTNAMRILDRMKISYNTYSYECDEFTDAQHTADQLGFAHEIMFKTLVTVSPSGEYYVFVLPIDDELDLKKAAKAVGEKSIVMLPQKELLPLTGYIHGGCSPIGMKKQFPTVLHESAADCETIYVSAGKIGYQVQLSPGDLQKMLPMELCDVIK